MSAIVVVVTLMIEGLLYAAYRNTRERRRHGRKRGVRV